MEGVLLCWCFHGGASCTHPMKSSGTALCPALSRHRRAPGCRSRRAMSGRPLAPGKMRSLALHDAACPGLPGVAPRRPARRGPRCLRLRMHARTQRTRWPSLRFVDARCASLFFLFSSRNPMTKTESTAWHQDIAHVVHPYSNLDAHSTLGPTVIARGDGCYVYDEHGKRYIEGMSGLWGASLGFSEKRLVDAATRQLNTLPYYHLFSHRSPPPGIALAPALTAVAPEGLNHVLFSSSGSEANDAAVKLIWYYNNLLGRPQKKKIISRLHDYHGVRVASGSLTGRAHVPRDFALPLPRVLHTDCPSHYHFGLPGESEPAFTQRITDNLEQLILKEGPETVAAFIAEPVSGAGGV